MPELFLESLRRTCLTPFLTSSELEVQTEGSVDTVRRRIRRLRRSGLIGYINAGTPTVAAAPRYYPTLAGVASAAESERLSVSEFRRKYRVSREWMDILLERLDSVIACYRLSQWVGRIGGPYDIHLSRTRIYDGDGLYDAVLEIKDGRTLGIIRQGDALREAHLGDVLKRLGDVGARPGAVLLLTPTRWHRQRAGNMVKRLGLKWVFLATERGAVSEPDWNEGIWNAPTVGDGEMLTLADILRLTDRFDVASRYRAGRDARRAKEAGLNWDPYGFVPTVRRARAAMADPQRLVSDAPAANLLPSEKAILDLVAARPSITRGVLIIHLGRSKGWVSRVLTKLTLTWSLIEEHVDTRDPDNGRLTLSERGCEYMASRDRVHPETARGLWSRMPDENGRAFGKLAEKARRLWRHQDGVYESVAQLGLGGADHDRILWVASELSVYYRPNRAARVITPDAIGSLVADGLYIPFFLEFERTAIYPSRIPSRLARYALFFGDPEAVRTVEPFPFVLFCFPNERFENVFLRVVAGADLSLPVLTSNLETLREVGGMGDAWRTSWPPMSPEDLTDVTPGTNGWDPLGEERLALGSLGLATWSHRWKMMIEYAPSSMPRRSGWWGHSRVIPAGRIVLALQ